jgi:hypothetical protein
LGAIAEKASDLFEEDVPREALPLLRRAGIGRAKGAGNRRTQEMRELYLRMGYTHPMLWLGEILSRPVHELARELHCHPVEALAEQRKAAADLMPYMESRQPLKIHDDRERNPNILIVGDVRAPIAAARQARADGSMSIDDDVLEAVANHVGIQRLTEGEAAKSQAEKVTTDVSACNEPENRHSPTDTKSVDDETREDRADDPAPTGESLPSPPS